MTISTTLNMKRYTADGVTVLFAADFPFFEAADLKVYVSDAQGNDGAPLPLNAGYTVAGAGTPSGGSVTFASPPAAGRTVTILRDLLPLQKANYLANDGFPAAAHQTAMDRLAAAAQDARAMAARSALFPLSDGAAPGPVPGKAARAGRIACYDAQGNPAVSQGLTADIEAPVTAAQEAAAVAQAAAAVAQDFVAALTAVSLSTVAIGTGPKSFTVPAGRQFAPGTFVVIADQTFVGNYMHGQVTSYSGTTLNVAVSSIGGSGTKSSWAISISSPQGPSGSPAWGGISGTLASQTDLAAELAKGKAGFIEAVFDGGGSVIPAGSFVDLVVDCACTITQATILGTPSGSASVEIRRCTYAQYDGGASHPVTADKITASTPPSLSGGVKAQDAALTLWSKTLAAGDVLRFFVASNTAATKLTVSLRVTKG